VGQGNGSIVLIAAVYNGAMQLLIRSYAEVNLSGARFTGLVLNKDFNDDLILSDGWTTQAVIESSAVEWETSSAGGAPNPYAVIKNYNFDLAMNEATDSWLISKSMDLSGSSAPSLTFDNAYNYGGAPLEVYVSTDYVSGAPSTGTWIDITSFANWSAGSFTFVNSGQVDLSAYNGANVHVAFRYQGSSSDGSTWELDNIIIKG
jgi:hypothetical protein